jgi:hypothetical protein
MPDSALLEEIQDVGVPEYSESEIKYLGALQDRLEQARNQREQKHDELDGMTYSQYWQSNERWVNTYIKPKEHKDENNYTSGLIRHKLFAFLAELIGLDLSPDISAYNEEQIEISRAGNAMEDVIAKTEELEVDEEKKILRQYELLKQGDVFVEEVWDEQFIKNKKIEGAKGFDGTIKGVSWFTRLKRKFARPVRNIIPGINVYLGSIREYESPKQPYIFTADYKPYSWAQAKYGKWERWKYVSRDLRPLPQTDGVRSLQYNNWRLNNTAKNVCEIIKYQDPTENEFAIIINGVLMTPVGLPLPWGYVDYNIIQQHLKPISASFAYAASLAKEMRNNTELLDDMKRALITKTWKSILPPHLNLSGKVVSRRVFMPGAITSNIAPGELLPISDKEVQGVTAGEYNMMTSLMQDIDRQSLNPVAAGQAPQGDPTATEVLQVSMQAKKALGVVVISASLLEWKLAWRRVDNLTAEGHWFAAEKEVVDDAKGQIVEKYRTVGMDRPIEGEGMGRRIVRIQKGQMPSPQELYDQEEQLKQQTGVPHRIIILNPEEMELSRITWQITVRPKQKMSSELSRLMLSRMMADIQFFGPTVNLEHLQERFANAWEADPSKLFTQAPMGLPTPEAQPGMPGAPAAAGITPPSPDAAITDPLKRVVTS